MSDQPDYCEFCEIDGFGNHAPRCPVALETEIAEHRSSFDLRWNADMRAIARWRAENPKARALTRPDHADLCVWLLTQLTETETKLDSSIVVGRIDEGRYRYSLKYLSGFACGETLADALRVLAGLVEGFDPPALDVEGNMLACSCGCAYCKGGGCCHPDLCPLDRAVAWRTV